MWDERRREEILDRIGRLQPGAAPLWGRMRADEMLAHLVQGMLMGMGELPTHSRKTILRHWPLKHLFVYWVPFPKGIARAPRELMTWGETPEWSASVERLRTLIHRFEVLDRKGKDWPVHPVFGPLNGKAWGALAWRHLDHHLRQFGV